MSENLTLEQPVDTQILSVADIRAEIDKYYAQLKDLAQGDLGVSFQDLSAISARASELRSILFDVESRRATALRTRHIEPLLEEVDRQFRILSRLQAYRQFEWDASKGGM